MKWSFGISDFLEEIPSLSQSVVFLYFFALIAEEGFLNSPFPIQAMQDQLISFSSTKALNLYVSICINIKSSSVIKILPSFQEDKNQPHGGGLE